MWFNARRYSSFSQNVSITSSYTVLVLYMSTSWLISFVFSVLCWWIGDWRSQLRSSAKKEVQLHWEHSGSALAPPIIFTLSFQDWRLSIWCSSGRMAVPGGDALTNSQSPSVLRPSNQWFLPDTHHEDNTLDEQPRSPPVKAPISGATTAGIRLRPASVCDPSEAIGVHGGDWECGSDSQGGSGRGWVRARKWRWG